jgi:hypothetical protein
MRMFGVNAPRVGRSFLHSFKPQHIPSLFPTAGGRLFDPIGFSRGSEAMYKKYKQNEIVNGRLAMVANLGFWAQYAATGKGPIQNLADHLADPYHTTFTTNGELNI